MGNLLSVKRAFEHIGAQVAVINNSKEIFTAERLIIPGVGAFPHGMEKLNSKDYVEPIKEFSKSSKPILAICLGMQLLMNEGKEHESTMGLGLIPGKSISIPQKIITGEARRVPHIGWNNLDLVDVKKSPNKGLFKNTLGGDMYFVHSFVVEVEDIDLIEATTTYEGFQFCSVVRDQNLVGCQFHPEKSGTSGLNFLSNFMNL